MDSKNKDGILLPETQHSNTPLLQYSMMLRRHNDESEV